MKVYKVLLRTTNGLKDTAYDEKNKIHIDVDNGFVYVEERDLNYVIEHFEWLSMEYVGIIYERPANLSSAIKNSMEQN